MRPMLEFLLALALIVAITLLIVQSTSEVRSQRQQLEDKLAELLGREEVTLADFISGLGKPVDLSVVTCEGSRCVRAVWDLSLSSRECWKRLIVVLNEEKKRVFFAETKELVVIERTPEKTRCTEAPG